MKLKITFLGTGTSQGIPVMGCNCVTCTSDDPRDNRLRCAILVQSPSTTIIVDAGPDFRQQMLRAKVQRLDAVLITHEHNDHIIGMDEIRSFNFKQRMNMPVYATQRVQEELKQRFAYIFAPNPYPGVPRLEFVTIDKNSNFKIGDIPIQVLEVLHGKMPVLGFRFGEFTYITDMKTITPAELEKVKGTKFLVASALHKRNHHSHMSLSQALEFVKTVQAERAYLTHISHSMGSTKDIAPELPNDVQFAYDGLELTIEAGV